MSDGCLLLLPPLLLERRPTPTRFTFTGVRSVEATLNRVGGGAGGGGWRGRWWGRVDYCYLICHAGVESQGWVAVLNHRRQAEGAFFFPLITVKHWDPYTVFVCCCAVNCGACVSFELHFVKSVQTHVQVSIAAKCSSCFYSHLV